MNKVMLLGRFTKDPDIRTSQGENSTTIARFSLAVDRRYKKDGDEQSADFINCVAFGKSAEFAEKYLKKGSKVAVAGRIQTGSYTNKEGQKVYTTDVVVEEFDFAGSKNDSAPASQTAASTPAATPGDGFINVPEGLDEELPFA